MGCSQGRIGCTEKERPAHEVTVSDFQISKYEVTVAQYRKFCTETGRGMPPFPEWGWSEDEPIVNVSWDDAQDFCKWTNCRLPTEAEWEYAARGGNKSNDYTYSGANTLRTVGIFSLNSQKKIQPIGQKLPNELGIYDMSGNASEWCNEIYAPYMESGQSSKDAPYGKNRVVRGGGYNNDEAACKVITRASFSQSQTAPSIGFRVVRNF